MRLNSGMRESIRCFFVQSEEALEKFMLRTVI